LRIGIVLVCRQVASGGRDISPPSGAETSHFSQAAAIVNAARCSPAMW
jgi:hypothetical protein